MAFEKKYPRRFVRYRRIDWRYTISMTSEPPPPERMWEIIHVRWPDSEGTLVKYADSLDEAQRIARHFRQ